MIVYVSWNNIGVHRSAPICAFIRAHGRVSIFAGAYICVVRVCALGRARRALEGCASSRVTQYDATYAAARLDVGMYGTVGGRDVRHRNHNVRRWPSDGGWWAVWDRGVEVIDVRLVSAPDHESFFPVERDIARLRIIRVLDFKVSTRRGRIFTVRTCDHTWACAENTRAGLVR